MSGVDVAIVGGGPAGASCALHLVRAERVDPARIVLLDKARFPRDKPCAGAVSRWGVEVLERLGVSLGVPRVEMRGLRVASDGRGAVAFRNGLGLVVRRDAFDAALLDEVRAAGVTVREGEAVTGISGCAGGVELRTERGSLTAKTVAACDGTGSGVRRGLGVGEACRKGHLYVLDTELQPGDELLRRGVCDFDLSCTARGVEGYTWAFPTPLHGATAVSFGIYHANLRGSAPVKDALAEALGRRGVRLSEVRLRPFSTRPFVRGAPLGLGPVLFVGEAAGIDAATGEGIAQALLMGGYAAQALGRALRGAGAPLPLYARALGPTLLLRRLHQSAWLAARVYGRSGAPYRRLLVRSPAAVAAGARWYEGERLSLGTKARLAAGLVRSGLEVARGARARESSAPEAKDLASG